MKHRARALRRNMTDAERHLWYYLRAHRFHGYKFRRQYPIDGFIVDFVCPEAMLIVEADGGQHANATPKERDRTARLESRGFRILRFWNHQILTETETVLEHIWQAVIERPLPNPSPGGRGARS